MSSQDHKQKLWNYIKDIKTGMLVTEDGDDIHARPMHVVQDDYDGTLWFFTKAASEKVEEVQKDRRVCVTFCDMDKDIHISLSGRARLNRDQDKINKFWNPVVSAWFPEGKEDPNCTLLEVKIHKGEHWDSDSNPISFLYEITKANIQDEYPDMGENQKFG